MRYASRDPDALTPQHNQKSLEEIIASFLRVRRKFKGEHVSVAVERLAVQARIISSLALQSLSGPISLRALENEAGRLFVELLHTIHACDPNGEVVLGRGIERALSENRAKAKYGREPEQPYPLVERHEGGHYEREHD